MHIEHSIGSIDKKRMIVYEENIVDDLKITQAIESFGDGCHPNNECHVYELPIIEACCRRHFPAENSLARPIYVLVRADSMLVRADPRGG